MNLFCEKNFSTNSWVSVTGSGSSTVNSGLLQITGAGTQRYMSYLIRPGDTIKVRVNAKCVGAAGGFVSLDIETKGTSYDSISLPISPDFDIYELEYTCPVGTADGVAVMFVVGNNSSATGSTVSSFFNPCVSLIGGSVATAPLRSLAWGLINVSKSQPNGAIVNQGFSNYGIADLAISSTSLRIIFDHTYVDYLNSIQIKRPLVFITPTQEGGSMVYCCGSIGINNGNSDKRLKADVTFYSSSTGTLIDPTTITNAYFCIELRAP